MAGTEREIKGISRKYSDCHESIKSKMKKITVTTEYSLRHESVTYHKKQEKNVGFTKSILMF